jgi:hypothetical protein
MSDEETVTALAREITRQTHAVLARHFHPKVTGEEWKRLIEKAHKDGLAKISDTALRFRVALKLQDPRWPPPFVDPRGK